MKEPQAILISVVLAVPTRPTMGLKENISLREEKVWVLRTVIDGTISDPWNIFLFM